MGFRGCRWASPAENLQILRLANCLGTSDPIAAAIIVGDVFLRRGFFGARRGRVVLDSAHATRSVDFSGHCHAVCAVPIATLRMC